MRFIIAGLSSIGTSLAELLHREGEHVVTVDSDKAKCDELAESSDILVMAGDITKKSVLEEAGGKNADALVALTDDDSDNLMACMLAKEMGTKKVISILNDTTHAEAFEEAGIDIQVKPDVVVARHIYYSILQPYVKDFVALGRADLFEVKAEDGMRCIGKSVTEMDIPKGVRVLWLERGEEYLNEDTIVAPKDRLTLVVNKEAQKKGAEFMNRCFAKG